MALYVIHNGFSDNELIKVMDYSTAHHAWKTLVDINDGNEAFKSTKLDVYRH
jgi:hypothetical protein